MGLSKFRQVFDNLKVFDGCANQWQDGIHRYLTSVSFKFSLETFVQIQVIIQRKLMFFGVLNIALVNTWPFYAYNIHYHVLHATINPKCFQHASTKKLTMSKHFYKQRKQIHWRSSLNSAKYLIPVTFLLVLGVRPHSIVNQTSSQHDDREILPINCSPKGGVN